jgi:hypothetical protein
MYMKTFIGLLLFLVMGSAMAQTQIPEGGFNNWTPNSTNVYFEPTGGWWTSLNSLATLGGPVTLSQTTDAHSGEFAALMETKLWGDLLLAGLLVSGNFILEEPFIQNGQPFTDSPSKFKGWYKYTPVSGDSAGVAAILTRYNTGAGQQDTIAIARRAIEENVQTYTEFEIAFDYLITGVEPDTLIIVFTSSGDGGNFNGEVGSTFIVDDISLEYTTGLLESLLPEIDVKAYPTPAADHVTFTFDTPRPEKLLCEVYTLDGRFIQSFSPNNKEHLMDVSSLPRGKYILQVFEDNSLVSSAKFIVAH